MKQQIAQSNARAADLQRSLHEKTQAVKAAEERARVEAQSGAQPADAAKHVEELRALEERLTKEHEEKLTSKLQGYELLLGKQKYIGGDVSALTLLTENYI